MSQTPVPNNQPSLALTEFVQTQGLFPVHDEGTGASGQFLGSIGIFAGNPFLAASTASGQLLGISQNTALFSLLGVNYGGNGTTTFQLPNLTGIVALGSGQSPGLSWVNVGENLGETGNVLSYSVLPASVGGGGQPVDAHQPSLGITYLINAGGIYPSSSSGSPDLETVGFITASAGTVGANELVCDGRLLPIAQYETLFNLIGTTYGGDGVETFALPNLQGRDIVGAGNLNGTQYQLGEIIGSETYTVQNSNLPASVHTPIADQQPGLVMNYIIALNGIFPSSGTMGTGNITTPYIGQIVAEASNVVPQGWALCSGQILPISQYQPLFALLGTTYGGDGITTFALPNLQGRTVVGADSGTLGQMSGSTTHSLTMAELPQVVAGGIISTSPTHNNGSSDTFTVGFSDSVTGVDASDFTVTTTGTVASSGLSVSGSGNVYTVTVSGVSGDGTLALALNNSGTGIANAVGNQIPGGASSPTLTIDHVQPTVATVTSPITGSTNAATLTETVTFSEAVTGVSASNFSLAATGVTGASIGSVTGSGTTYTVVLNTGTGDGTLKLNLDTLSGIVDLGGNALASGGSGPTTTIDHTAPAAPVVAAPANNALLNTTTPSYAGTAEAGSTITFYVDGNAVGTTTAAGGSFSLTNPAALSQGSHSLYTTATDAATNVSVNSNTETFTIDTVAPTLAITSNLAQLKIGQTAAITFTFSEDPGASFTDAAVTVSGGTLSAISGSGTVRTATFTPTADLDNGTATISVASNSYQDAAGNLGGQASQTLSFDTHAPATPSVPALTAGSDTGVSQSDGITNVTTPTVTGTADAGATVTLYDTDGTTVLGTTTATGGAYSITSATLGEGSHNLTVKATDTGGNVSAASTGLSFTIDTTAPTLAITSNVAQLKIGETAVINFTFSEDPGASFTNGDVTVSGGTLSAISGSGTVRTATFTPTANIDNGTATIAVASNSYQDTAGNSGGQASQALTFDTHAPAAPAAPALSAGSDSGASQSDGITNVTTPTVTGTAEAGATVTLYDTDGTTVLGSGTATGGNYSITSATLSAGSHTISAKATDAGGNASAASTGLSVTIDTTAPTLAITSNVAQLKIGETAVITFTFSEDPGASFTNGNVTVSGGTLSALSGSGTVRTATFTPTSNLDNGTATISVASNGYQDTAGNSGGQASQTLTFDTHAPAAPSTPALTVGSDSGASQSDGITKITTPTVTGTAEAGATVTLYDTDGTTVLGSATATGGSYSITSAALTEGNHSLTVKATDMAGNTSVASTALAVTLDTTAPVLTLANQGGTVSVATQVISGTLTDPNEIGATITLREGSTVLGTAIVQADLSWSASVNLGADGAHTVTASATDRAGNIGQTQVSYTVGQPGSDPGGPLVQSPPAGETQTLSDKTDGSLEKDGAGTLVITGTNTYPGPTDVKGGLLIVDGSIVSSVTVENGAVLGGHGSTGNVTIQTGGTLSPGNSPGVLSTKDLSLSTGAALKEEIGGTAAGQFDQLHVSGSVTLGGATLNAVSYGAFVSQHGDSFVIIDNDGTDAVSGAFAGLNEGASLSIGTRSYQITYRGGDGNDVVLTDVTAPGSTPSASFGSVEHNPASQTGSVYALYEALLNRAPDLLGLENVTTALRVGTSLTDLAQSLLTSPEHGPQAASTTAFVESLYTNVLGRTVDAGGLAYLTDELNHGISQAQVAVQVATSSEAQAHIKPSFDTGVFVPDSADAAVARLYYGLLDRAPDAGGLQSLAAAITLAGPAGAPQALKGAIGAILASQEYLGTHTGLTDPQFVDDLYQGAMGRHADAGGLQYWQDRLARGATRTDVALEITQSQEAQVHLVGQIEAGWHLA